MGKSSTRCLHSSHANICRGIISNYLMENAWSVLRTKVTVEEVLPWFDESYARDRNNFEYENYLTNVTLVIFWKKDALRRRETCVLSWVESLFSTHHNNRLDSNTTNSSGLDPTSLFGWAFNLYPLNDLSIRGPSPFHTWLPYRQLSPLLGSVLAPERHAPKWMSHWS